MAATLENFAEGTRFSIEIPSRGTVRAEVRWPHRNGPATRFYAACEMPRADEPAAAASAQPVAGGRSEARDGAIG